MSLKKLAIGLVFLVIATNLYCKDIYLNLTASSNKETRRQFIFLKDFEILGNLELESEIGTVKSKTAKNSPVILNNKPNKIYDVINNDLQLDNRFKVENSSSVNKSIFETNIDYDAWIFQNIDYIITGEFDNKTEILNIELFYSSKKEKIFGKKYDLSKEDLKVIAHMVSDEIIFVITGYKGLNSTKMIFSYSVNVSTGNLKEANVKELYTVDFDGNDLTQITDNKSITILPDWNPKEKQILYTSYKFGNPDLFLYDFATNKTVFLSDKQGLNMGAQYSPQGDKIAMARTINGNSEIVIIDAEENGQQLERITKNKFIDFSPTWLNDSTKLAFISDRTGATQIYVYNFENGESYPLTFDKNYKDFLNWSSVNNELVFSGLSEGQWNIFKIDFKTKQILKLTDNAGNNEDPSWSPDGEYICFTSTRNGKKELFVMKKDGTNQRKVFSGSGNVYSPKWSPLYK